MRIFKRQFSEELTKGMSVGECIITKIDDTPYGEFAVYRKESNEAFPYLGCFCLLQEAIKYVKSVEEPEIKYEYYLQSQKELKEGWNREQLEVMGQLGWELCGIQSNITDDEGKAMFIYKRKLPNSQIDFDKVPTELNYKACNLIKIFKLSVDTTDKETVPPELYRMKFILRSGTTSTVDNREVEIFEYIPDYVDLCDSKKYIRKGDYIECY